MLTMSNLQDRKLTPILLMIAAVFIALIIAVWSYYSGQLLLKQQVPLVDQIMQIRVDISQAHGVLDKAYVMSKVKKINDYNWGEFGRES